MSTPAYQLYVGIASAAATAMVTWTGPSAPAPFRIDQTPVVYAALQQRLRATGIVPEQTLVVMEATGTYGVRLACALHPAGYQISVVTPKRRGTLPKRCCSAPRRIGLLPRSWPSSERN